MFHRRQIEWKHFVRIHLLSLRFSFPHLKVIRDFATVRAWFLKLPAHRPIFDASFLEILAKKNVSVSQTPDSVEADAMHVNLHVTSVVSSLRWTKTYHDPWYIAYKTALLPSKFGAGSAFQF